MSWNSEYEIENDLAVIRCEGEVLGEEQGPDLIELVNDIISKNVKNTVIDVSEVKYINSSGIGVLITTLTKFRNAGGDIVLLNPSDHVQKLLVMTKLNAIFNIEEDVAKAKDKLRNQ